ncbi:MAG: sulfatase [Candidatus Hodarchaeota archaeon]
MKEQQPNVIFVFADQLRLQSVGYAGDSKARTPNIDKFAKESLDFRQAVVSHPVCSAMRASLFTGKYTSSTGMVINELRMNPNHECVAHVLTREGYSTAYIGKWHLYANELGNHYDAKNSFTPPGPHRLGFDGYWASYGFHHVYYDAYYHENTPDKIPYGENNEEIYEPDAQTDMAMDQLEKFERSGEKFCMILSYGTPHDPWMPWNVPDEYFNMFKDVSFPQTPSYSDELDPYGDAWSNIDKSPKQIEEWMRVYYAMTTNLDWNFGRLVKKIDELGLGDDTIIIFTSDHGECFGAHGRMKKNIFYEEACRIPFLMRWPGHVPSGEVTDALLNTPDIMPTLLGLVGAPIPKEVEGSDLSSIALGKDEEGPKAAFLMNTGACAAWEDGHEWRALRDKRYIYAVYKKDGAELLFDNVEDPYQKKNLVKDSMHQDQLERFRKMLKEKMDQLNDSFPKSTWYRENWIENREIKRTATLK